jgi:pilus assembly protein Flp/PilA
VNIRGDGGLFPKLLAGFDFSTGRFWADLLRISTFTDGSGIVAYNIGVLRTFKTFLKDESGATAIEYGLIAAGIALTVIPVIQRLGTSLKTTFTTLSTGLK